MFIPKETKSCLYGVPTVLITEEAAKDMWHIVNECPTEVGWMMRATLTKEKNILLDKVYLLHQQAHATTTELSEEGLSKLAEELLATGDKGIEEWNKVRCWMHSHVNMPTGPSGQDNTQMDVFSKADVPWMLRGIANKAGDIRFDLYMYDYGVRIEELKFKIITKEAEVDDPRRTFWKKALDEKVKPFTTPASTTHTGYRYTDGYGAGYNPNRYDYGSWGGKQTRGRKEKFRGAIFGAIASGRDVPETTPAGTTSPPGGPVGANPTNGVGSNLPGGSTTPGASRVLIPAGSSQPAPGVRFDGDFGGYGED